MITEEKIKEIKKQVKRGVPAGEIREAMTRQGYSEEDIEKCFEVKKFSIGSWYLVLAFLFFIAGLWIWMHPADIVFGNERWTPFIVSAVLLARYIMVEQKKKDAGND